MKDTIGHLLSLFGRCSDDKDKAKKLQLIARITQSNDYKELGRATALKITFEDNFSLPKLELLDNDALIQREELLHKLALFHSKLLRCIRFGNGPKLTPEDRPDFNSVSSITESLGKIQITRSQINFSNISDKDVLAVFSDKTIRSAQKCFDMLPISLTTREEITEEDISKYMGSTLYCFPIETFVDYHGEFLAFSRKAEEIVQADETRRNKSCLLKLVPVLVCLGVIFAFSQFGFIADSFTPILYTAVFVASVIYMIWG